MTRADRRDFIRRNRLLLGAVTVGWIVLGSFLVGLIDRFSYRALVPYLIGGLVVGYGWFMITILNQSDGTWLRAQGAMAEESTASSLKPLCRRGWSLTSAVCRHGGVR